MHHASLKGASSESKGYITGGHILGRLRGGEGWDAGVSLVLLAESQRKLQRKGGQREGRCTFCRRRFSQIAAISRIDFFSRSLAAAFVPTLSNRSGEYDQLWFHRDEPLLTESTTKIVCPCSDPIFW